MKLVAGIDIGNATTETALARIEDGHAVFLASGTVPTTGIKGTRQNINGIFHSLTNALEKAGLELKELSEVRLNEAAPVIGDVAMETITETIITESTMIGHNPATPGGMGVGVGETVLITELEQAPVGRDYIAVVPGTVDFEVAARLINRATAGDRKVTAAIVQRDDGVLIHNRLTCKIPIVDEVALIDKVPIGMRSAVEVAAVGGVVEVLSNPYGIATLFGLSSDETRQVVPIARALIGNRSAVVIKTPAGDVKERKIPAGTIELLGENRSVKVDVDDGADKIMKAVESIPSLEDVRGEPGTNAGGMLEKVRQVMANLTSQHPRTSDSGSAAIEAHSPDCGAAWPKRVFPGERRGHRRHGQGGPPPDGGHRPGICPADRRPGRGGRRGGRHGHPRRPHHQEDQQALGRLDMGAGSTDAPSSTPRDRSTPSTWPERATWSHS